MTEQISLVVNGARRDVAVEPRRLLVQVIRDDLGLTGTHVGCDTTQCGACTVHLDGKAIRSCSTPIAEASGHDIKTLAGLGTEANPHPVQKAYLEEQVPQCGYCINGWVMTAAAFLETKKNPTDAEIKEALAGIKCRCGTHTAIMRAVRRAADSMA